MDGQEVCLGNAGSRSQALLFVAGDCENCPAAVRALEQLREVEAASARLEVLLVALDDPSAGQNLTDGLSFDLPVLAFPHPRWRDVFRVRDVPQLVVLDPEGRTRVARTGIPSRQLLVDSVLPLAERLEAGSVHGPWVAGPCGQAAQVAHLQQGGS